MGNKKDKTPKRWVACPIEEEYFGSEDRKSSRKERKRLTAKDRSKYKKTDAKMLEKDAELPKDKSLKRGRVLSIASQGMLVDVEGESYTCFLRGALKKEKTRVKNLVVVGDFVLFEPLPEMEGSIVSVEQRRSTLSRADNLSKKKEQLIAANIDQVLITVSVVSPILKPSLIDRYIIATVKGKMSPVIVVNKCDLLADSNFDETIRSEQEALLRRVIEAYRNVDIPVITTCVDSGEGIDLLTELMEGKASVFSGQSGVGKSSLINVLCDLDLPVGEVVEKTSKGAHTTTTAQLIRMECGGFCIDTPGIKSFGVWDLKEEDLQNYFAEIKEASFGCKFKNCSHIHEEGCAVMEGVDNQSLSSLRYESYKNLYADIRKVDKRR